MEILIRSIDNPITVAQRNGSSVRLVRFNVEFEMRNCAGEAYLFVLHASPHVDINNFCRNCIGRSFKPSASVEKISDFKQLPGEGHACITPLGIVGAFAFEGRIIQHYFTGEGSFFQAQDIEFMIGAEQVPADSLEVEEGTWVSFKAEGLGFLIT